MVIFPDVVMLCMERTVCADPFTMPDRTPRMVTNLLHARAAAPGNRIGPGSLADTRVPAVFPHADYRVALLSLCLTGCYTVGRPIR